MTNEHVEGNCMEDYLQDYGGWFARERILTKQKTFLATDSKVISFGLAKDILRHKFKEHDLWKRDETGWWTEMHSDFKKESNKMRMNDENIAQERKSEPLYWDVSSSGQSNFVCAKYAGLDVVDSRTVAMSILHRGNRQSSQFLLEFSICRSAVGGGGKHRACHTLHLGEKSSEIQLIMAFLTQNRRNFRLNCQFSTFHVTIRLYK